MGKLSHLGRVFFGISIAVMGIQTVVDRAFPYMLIPPKLSWRPDAAIVPYFFGTVLAVAGLCIVFNRKTRQASLLLAGLLALVFVFYYLPFQFIVTDYTQLVNWENAEKELDLACGALIVAECFSDKDTTRLLTIASVLFAITIISYGIIHFQHATAVADYVPSWVPARLFWAYLAGAGLLASGISMVINVKKDLAAFLLGVMIFIWFVVLHVPRVITAEAKFLPSEISSACLALAYSGIAFMIARKFPLKNLHKTS
ncbi:MAG TPA: hypothetical protein VF473_10310 [Cyclobacteriaceae bacterium]